MVAFSTNGFLICRHITRKFCRKLLYSSHWRIEWWTVSTVTDRRMNPSCQVRLSVNFKLGHKRRNQRWIITYETDHCPEIIASLMRHTRPDPARVFKKNSTFKTTNPSFHPIPSLFLPFLSFSTLKDHNISLLQPIIFPKFSKFLKFIIYYSERLLWVSTWSPSTFLSCFSQILRYVSLISTHLYCIFVYKLVLA